jgi:hypothetical protein
LTFSKGESIEKVIISASSGPVDFRNNVGFLGKGGFRFLIATASFDSTNIEFLSVERFVCSFKQIWVSEDEWFNLGGFIGNCDISKVLGFSVDGFELASVVELFSFCTGSGLSFGNGGKGLLYRTPEGTTSFA